MSEGGVRLLIDLRRFDIAITPATEVTIELSAKLVDGAGNLKAARIFKQSAPIGGTTVAQAATAFRGAFDVLARDVVTWTASTR
jgi:phospholipid/cholesterol/gamma-HCH transport system substrate-binding protein